MVRRFKVTSEQMKDEGRVLVFDPCYFFTIVFAWLYSVFIVHIFRVFPAYSVIYRYLEEESMSVYGHNFASSKVLGYMMAGTSEKSPFPPPTSAGF